jgi:hypothetical protein
MVQFETENKKERWREAILFRFDRTTGFEPALDIFAEPTVRLLALIRL